MTAVEAWVDPPATPQMPDRTQCRNCGRWIYWDDYSYTHADSGFAECAVMLVGGRPVADDDPELLRVAESIARRHGSTLIIDLQLVLRHRHDWRAEPVDWDYYGRP